MNLPELAQVSCGLERIYLVESTIYSTWNYMLLLMYYSRFYGYCIFPYLSFFFSIVTYICVFFVLNL
jgi:hypothetical protein